MIKNLLEKHSVFKLTVGFTLLSITLALLFANLVNWVIYQTWLDLVGVVITVIVISMLAPTFLYTQFKLMSNLMETQERLKILAITDDLTQVYNRRHFFSAAQAELNRLKRYSGWLSIALVDFDNFKNINDSYGHLAGDEVLRQVSKILSQQLRELDIIARYGGEEFILLFPNTDQQEIKTIANRLSTLVSDSQIEYEGQEIKYSVSIGTSSIKGGEVDLDYLIRLADRALYRAKQAGGNTVKIGESMLD